MKEKIFWKSINISAILLLLLVLGILITLAIYSFDSIKEFGFRFFYSSDWNPVKEQYGALPFLIGTVVTSVLALLISLPFSLSSAILIGIFMKKRGGFLAGFIELLAAVPSVIYGFWGLIFLVPLIRSLESVSVGTMNGANILSSSIILAIMIIPYSASLSIQMIKMSPKDLSEAAYAMGSTRFEVVKKIILPNSFSGIMAGNLLAFGRALGETMAVTMVIGNANKIPHSIFSPANTMASVIANEFTEAAERMYLSSLIEIGLVLFFVTVVFNVLGKQIIKRSSASR